MSDLEFQHETFEEIDDLQTKISRNLRFLTPLLLVQGILYIITAGFNVLNMVKGKGALLILPVLIFVIFGLWHIQASNGLRSYNQTRDKESMVRFSDRIAFYFMIQGILLIIAFIIILIVIAINLASH